MTTVMPPEGDCPKCGTPNAWNRSLPHYRHGDLSLAYSTSPLPRRERLDWPCKVCGYVRETPTADAEPSR